MLFFQPFQYVYALVNVHYYKRKIYIPVSYTHLDVYKRQDVIYYLSYTENDNEYYRTASFNTNVTVNDSSKNLKGTFSGTLQDSATGSTLTCLLYTSMCIRDSTSTLVYYDITNTFTTFVLEVDLLS